jgi:hypothetical protein
MIGKFGLETEGQKWRAIRMEGKCKSRRAGLVEGI